MILENLPYFVAFVTTAMIHMAWSSIPFAIHQQFSLLASARSSAAVNIIKLHVIALVLLASSLSLKTTSAASVQDIQLHQTYNFDDLNTTHGLGYISSYNLLAFAGFSVLAPNDPKLPYIQPWDRNCAISCPNALLGSRYSPRGHRPTVMVNVTQTKLKNVHASFDLHSISVKPLAMPVDPLPVVANVTIRGWTADVKGTGEPLVFRVVWASEYTKPLLVDFDSKQFSPHKWMSLKLLDFSVDFGPDRLDWEFCLDDLNVTFTKCNQNSYRDCEKLPASGSAVSVEREGL